MSLKIIYILLKLPQIIIVHDEFENYTSKITTSPRGQWVKALDSCICSKSWCNLVGQLSNIYNPTAWNILETSAQTYLKYDFFQHKILT